MAHVRRLCGSEAVTVVSSALRALVWLAGVMAATGGILGGMVASAQISSAIVSWGLSPIAKAAMLGAFWVGTYAPAAVLVEMWVRGEKGFRDGVVDLSERLEARSNVLSPGRGAEGECVEAVRKHVRVGLGYVEQIVQELRAEGSEVTIDALVKCINDLAEVAVDPQFRVLSGFADCLHDLVKEPAEDSFDRAVREGACPVGLLERILGC